MRTSLRLLGMAQRKNSPVTRKKATLPWRGSRGADEDCADVGLVGEIYMSYSAVGQTATFPQRPEAINSYASLASSRVKRCVTMSSGCRFQRTSRSTSSSMSQVEVTQEPKIVF